MFSVLELCLAWSGTLKTVCTFVLRSLLRLSYLPISFIFAIVQALRKLDNAPLSWSVATPWEQKLKDLMWSMDDGHARFRHQKFQEVFEAQQESTPLQTIIDAVTHNMPKFSLPLGEETIPVRTHLLEHLLIENEQP